MTSGNGLHAGLYRVPGSVIPALLVSLAALLPALAGCRKEKKVDPGQVITAFKKIHRRIYDVYRLKDPKAVFALLSSCLAGPELEKQVYEYLKCLEVQEEFQTRISILDVIYTDVELQGVEGNEAVIYCKWVVVGKVYHPTHIHRRNNLNEALYRMRLDGRDGPRITGYEIITNQGLEMSKP